ncbi:MAG: hypothetical protein RR279_01945 [Alistipes sp.]
MKQVFSFLALFCLLCSGAVFTGCSDDPTNPEPVPVPDKPTAKLELVSAATNSAELKLTTTLVQEFAYLTIENGATAPEAAVIFGTGTVATAIDGENAIKIKGLEAEKDYTTYVATKSTNVFGEVLSQEFHTAKYTQFITLIDADFFSVTFHIEVPEGKIISYGVSDRDTYLGMKEQFRYLDADFISGNPKVVNLLTESTTVVFDGWNEEDNETGAITKRAPLPGQALYLIAGEVQLGKDEWTGEPRYIALFDYAKYWGGSGGGDPLMARRPNQEPPTVTEDECWLTEYHAAVPVNCKAPDRMDAHVKIEVAKHTTRSIAFNLTPDAAMLGYGWMAVPVAAYETIVARLGSEAGALNWISTAGIPFETGPVMATVDNLALGTTYRLIILGVGNEERTLQSVDFYDFTAAEATKPAPKVVVKGIKAPEGETESSRKVWFNVKAPNMDLVRAKYLCNSPAEWTKEMNSAGATYKGMIETYGIELSSADVAAVNSPAGFNINFSSWEDSETRLVIVGYNDEETGSDPDADADGRADMRTIPDPAAPRVESALFTELLGDWTLATHRYVQSWDQETGATIWTLEAEPFKTKVTIAAEPEYSTTCPENAYALYPDKTRAEVDALYADFVKSAVKYAGKVRGQNRLVCLGFHVGNQYSTPYKSPTELFCDPTYSAYDSDEIFFDYGPKWYIQIAADGTLSVPVDLSMMTPVSNWYYDQLYLVGANHNEDPAKQSYLADLKKFDMTLSENHKEMSFVPAKNTENDTFYPSLASFSTMGASVTVKCHDITLTKGWTEPAAGSVKNAALKSTPIRAITPLKMTPSHKRPQMGHMTKVNFKKVAAVTPLTLDKINAMQKAALAKKRH